MKTLSLPSVDERVEEILRDPDAYVRKVRADRERRHRPGAWLNDAPPARDSTPEAADEPQKQSSYAAS